ncbi:multidrug ABC transporter permease/ATP-binding protein [Bacillus sp. M6-12]|uniref:ABC transporter transmembrane domain-containing protein n=1 Tax=Bacillus sp. M6-12 TaxID=2054166 RepID=UPI000C78552A|nr:ABC transporter transmembrane domain-containing protein [Bacillus sp. M6-12]PLS16786.1 multidrug ABC transporter permease/ATP-binding protein [Bacillus sp. M6-12]
MKVFRQLMWFFRQEKNSYILGILLLCMVAVLQLVPPKIIGIIVDLIENRELTIKTLFKWMGYLALAGLVMYGLRYYWRIMIFGSAVKLSRQLRNQLYDHFTNMSQAFYKRKRIGDLMAHATNDLQAIQQTAGAGVLTLVDSLATGGFVIVAMSLINWKLTLICLLPMPIMAYLTSYYGTLLHNRFHKAQEAFSDLNDKTQESINGIKVIKTFGQEKEDIDAFRKQSFEVVRKNIAVARVDALFDPTISVIVGLSYFLTVAVGARFVLSGEMSIGDLVSFSSYLGLLIWPMLAFGWLFNIVERGRASYDRVQNLLNEKADIADKENAIQSAPAGDLVFRISAFRFPDDAHPVLKNITFNLKRGETLGVAGKTGSGKTSLLKLLTREFDQYEGTIQFGGNEIKEFSIQHFRNSIGYVPQDHFLFSATVADNIAFARPEAGYSEIMDAAQSAHIHNDILQFSEGYETVVGERGVSLSGGQKQRISIARALIKNPELLILDDSLSAVDARTEEMILQNLKENRNGKTTIITAHRLSAIQHANLIIVLNEGTIVQSGTHQQLMSVHGWYKDMFIRQQLEELVEHGGGHGRKN